MRDEDICSACGHDKAWHQENRPRHVFNGGLVKEDDAPKPDVRDNGPEWPLDPVLRQALINKGVLTPQDLRDAEEQIKAVTASFRTATRESRHGQ